MFIPFGFMATQAGGGGDADATAYIDEVIAAGGTLSAGDQTAIDTLYTSLKSNSLYTELTFMYPFMGGTPDSHKVEGLAPTDANTLLTWYGGISQSLAHTSDGVDKTVSNSYGYGTPNFAPPAVNISKDDITIGAYVSTAVTNDQNFIVSSIADALLGSRNQLNIPFDDNNVYVGLTTPDNWAIYNNGSAPVGIWVASRTSSILLTLYKNGSSVTTNTQSNTAALNINNYSFFSHNGNITSSGSFNGVCGFIFGANGLTGGQVSTFNGILQTFLTAIGR